MSAEGRIEYQIALFDRKCVYVSPVGVIVSDETSS